VRDPGHRHFIVGGDREHRPPITEPQAVSVGRTGERNYIVLRTLGICGVSIEPIQNPLSVGSR
jgi:hypothetical protein